MQHEMRKCVSGLCTRILAVICVVLLLVTSTGMTVLADEWDDSVSDEDISSGMTALEKDGENSENSGYSEPGTTIPAEEWDNSESSEEELVGLGESNTWTVGDGVSASLYNEDGRNVLYFDSDGGTLSATWKSILGDVADDVNVIRFTDESTTMHLPNNCDALFSLQNVEEINLEKADTLNVEYMGKMFYDCRKLVSLDLTAFDTSNVISMYCMFSGCESLQHIDVSSFDTSNVSNMFEMFMDCGSLTELDLSNFNMANVDCLIDDEEDDGSRIRLIEGCTGLQLFKTPYTTRFWAGFNLPVPMYDEEDTQYTKLRQALEHSITLVTSDSDEVKDFSLCEVSLEQTHIVYGGNAKMPDVVVQDGDKILIENVDYTVDYINFYNAGTATVRVVGIGDYSGVQRIPFEIEKADPVLAFYAAELTKKTNSEDFFNELYLCERDGKDTFESSNESVAVVDPYSGIVSIKGVGTAVITMYVSEGTNYKAGSVSYTVTVQDAEAGAEYEWSVGKGVTAHLVYGENENVLYFDSKGGELRKDWKIEIGLCANDVNRIAFTEDSTVMYLPEDSGAIFFGLTNLWEMDTTKINTERVINMSEMFYECNNLKNLNLNGFYFSSVTDMSRMFCRCYSLENLDLSGADTPCVTDMSSMFEGCSSLESLDLTFFDTSSVTNMSHMFLWCSKLSEVEIYNFDTTSVTNMSGMFEGCHKLTDLDLSGFDTSNVTTMWGMFDNCSGLTSLDVSSFDTSSVTNMGCMFDNCSGLTSLDLSGFDTSAVTNMSGMFGRCSGLTCLDLSGFDTSNVTGMGSMFWECRSLESINLESFDTSQVTGMYAMFEYCSSLKTIDLSGFDTGNVERMAEMFAYCTNLENVNISSFNTLKVALISGMFEDCSSLTEIDLSSFDLRGVMRCNIDCYPEYERRETLLFEGCSSLQVLKTPIRIGSGCVLPITMYDESGTAYRELPYKMESITLTNVPGPVISEQPTASRQIKGKRVKMSVAAEGEDLTYRWQSLKPGTSSWVNSGLASAKTATLSFTMSQGYDGMQYRCVVTDRFGRSVTSDAATVSLIAAPVITEQPASVESAIGVNVKLSVAVEGTGLAFRWQYLRPGTTTWNNSGLSSATTATLRFKMGDGYDGMKFRCVVTNADDVSTTSDVATITAVRGPAIVMQPSDVDAASGTAVRISTQATGKDLTYRWQYKKMGSTTWVNSGLSSANTPVLSFKMSSGYDGRKYRCRVMDADENVVYTDTVLVTLVDGPAITKQPVDVTAAIGTRGVFSISATGEGLSYQWQYQKPGTTTWTNSGSSGNKTATIRVGATNGTNGMKFRCVVTDEEGIVAVSYGAVLTVN